MTGEHMHTASKERMAPELTRSDLEWSGFAGCFFQAQWQSVHVVWGLNGALISLGMAVFNCTALWC